MKIRSAKMVVNKSGSGSSTFRATLPATWIREMGLSENVRDIVIKKDLNEISIRRRKEGDKIFVGGYYGSKVKMYTLEEALQLPFIENVVEWYEEESEKPWDELSESEIIDNIIEYNEGDECAGLIYCGCLEWCIETRSEIEEGLIAW